MDDLLMDDLPGDNRGSGSRRKIDSVIVAVISISWALWQLALPRLLILDSLKIRAIHLAFAVTLVYLTFPFRKHKEKIQIPFGPQQIPPGLQRIPPGPQRIPPGPQRIPPGLQRIPPIDYFLAALAGLAVLYIMLDWTGISMRSGKPLMRDVLFSVALIILLLEASRRVVGPALAIIVILFSLYAFFGSYMPSIFALKGISLTKYVSQLALSTEGIYGIPLDVSASTVFLFVLLGAMLNKVGAGIFFNDLALALLGKYKGGPAKAAVVSSGFTGIFSGSSIANVVTTGTFTIPLMKKVGYPGKIAAATEVAASTNGQLMPPIMGAAAFIIAEYLALPYIDVVKAAVIPAVVSYFALFYITHLEASKLGMSGLPEEEIPKLKTVLKNGFYFLIPLVVLLYELMVLRHTPKLGAYRAILALVAIVFVREMIRAIQNKSKFTGAIVKVFRLIGEGLFAGSRDMLAVALATATAGIVVGIVTMGIGSMIVQIVEILSCGSIFLLLLLTAVASLILGMGLPTTATYIVMASITVPVIIQLSAQNGISAIPAISAHLFCFYFGILADDTPPVGLAAYAAAAIAKSDPIQTGIQGFKYDLRTAVIPFMFVFNPELVLHGVENVFQGFLIFGMAVLGAFAFTNAVQGRFIVKNKWYEVLLFLTASLIFFYPAILTKAFHWNESLRYYMGFGAAAVYALAYLTQRRRLTC